MGPTATSSPRSPINPPSPTSGSNRNVLGVHNYRPGLGGDQQSTSGPSPDKNQSGLAGGEEEGSGDVIPPPDDVSGIGGVLIFLVILMISTFVIIICLATQCRAAAALYNFIRGKCG